MGHTNTPLRRAIFDSGLKQIDIAKRIDMHDTRLSKIVHGYIDANDDEKKALARVLRRPIDELFPEPAARTA
jgi:transcriptional regulator with XRE-family HTH domain